MTRRLENKVAIITGGASGIGAAIARKFAQEGARVVVQGTADENVEAVVDHINECGGKAVAFVGDISKRQMAQECVQKAIDKFGKLNILINNAGAVPPGAEVNDYSLETFNITLANIGSVFLMTKFAVPHLQQTQGNIISTGNEAGTLGLAGNTAYGGAKGWIHAFTKGVAVEQAKHGIRANCVCPGQVEVDGKAMASTAPLGRRGTTNEIANVFAFLASDMASYVTGALWAVDGGTIVGKSAMASEEQKN